MNLVQKAKKAYIGASIGVIILGIVLIIKPTMSAITLCYIIGAMMITFGVIKIIGFFSKDQFRLAFQFDLALGIFSIVVGAFIAVKAKDIMLILPTIIGIFIIIDGVFKVQTAIDAKRFGIKRWKTIMLLALFCVTLGIILIVNPYEAVKALMIFTGVTLLVDGIQNICVVMFTVKSDQGRFIDEDFFN